MGVRSRNDGAGVGERLSDVERKWLESNTRYVYFIQSGAKGKPVKIGWSSCPENRIEALKGNGQQSWEEPASLSLLFTIPVAYPQQQKLEDEIHGLVNPSRVDRSEWFVAPNWSYLSKIKRHLYIADWSQLDQFLESA